MGRNRYTIQAADQGFAWRWINKKLNNPLWLGETNSYAAYQAFVLLEEGDVASLNGWCEAWLDTLHWTQLKNSIRAGRKRGKGESTKTVTLSRNAWAILDYWATQDGCTLSEVIERRLGGGRANG